MRYIRSCIFVHPHVSYPNFDYIRYRGSVEWWSALKVINFRVNLVSIFSIIIIFYDSSFYGAFSVTRLYRVDDRVTSDD
jgi:hypothetical protein